MNQKNKKSVRTHAKKLHNQLRSRPHGNGANTHVHLIPSSSWWIRESIGPREPVELEELVELAEPGEGEPIEPVKVTTTGIRRTVELW